MVDLTMKVDVVRKTSLSAEKDMESLAVESPLTIYFNEKEIATLLCTPSYLDELAVGFLASEGMIKAREDIEDIYVDEEKGAVWITGTAQPLAEKMFLKRSITTGCGKGTTFYNVLDAQIPPVETDLKVYLDKVMDLMHQVQRKSDLYVETRGVHGNALCDQDKIIVFRDDVGRHNATDKIIGRCFLDGIDLSNKMLLTSGRISSEILIKSAKMGIPIVVSKSVPTALAVEIAKKLGVTVCGSMRAKKCNIYSIPQRIVASFETEAGSAT